MHSGTSTPLTFNTVMALVSEMPSALEIERIAKLPRVFEKSASAKSLGPMMQETRDLLDDFYSRYNKKLAARLDNSAYMWKR